MNARPTRQGEANRFLTRRNLLFARKRWGPLIGDTVQRALFDLSQNLSISIESGDLLLIEGKWYVTHSGLLRLATRKHCAGIHVAALPEFCDASASRWAFKATVYRSRRCKGFVGYGDADPSNVSPLVHGAEMRVAETRAVNRALRKAYGIGLCSVEEIGAPPDPSTPLRREPKRVAKPAKSNGHSSLRDRLSQLIRQHQLNPALVKLYATEYCGTKELREAKREQIESFVNHLTQSVLQNRDALVCQLNSYAQKDADVA